MIIPNYRVLHTDQDGVVNDVKYLIELSSEEGIETKNDTCTFRIPWVNYVQNSDRPPIKVGDYVQIFFGTGSSALATTSDNLVMSADITSKNPVLEEARLSFEYKGSNKTERLLNHQDPADFPTQTSSEAGGCIQWFINRINDKLDADRQISWVAGNATGSHSPVTYSTNYKPVITHIETLSKNEYTSNGDKIFYLDNTNGFHWENRPITISSTLREGSDFFTINLIKDTFDVINTIIINAGKDLNDNRIHTIVYNPLSVGQLKGNKHAYEVDEDISNSLANEDDAPVDNDDFRAEVIRRAKAKWQAIVDKSSLPRWRGSGEVAGTNLYTKGGMYTIIAPSFDDPFIDGHELRLMQISHSFNTRGWIVTLDFEEDSDYATF